MSRNTERVIVGNNYSYQITLPKEWVKNNDLQKGDKVNLTIKRSKLIIRK